MEIRTFSSLADSGSEYLTIVLDIRFPTPSQRRRGRMGGMTSYEQDSSESDDSFILLRPALLINTSIIAWQCLLSLFYLEYLYDSGTRNLPSNHI